MLAISVSMVPVALAALFLGWAGAQEATGRIAVIDVQRIFREAQSAKSLQEELDVRRGTIEAELRRREHELRQADLDLRRARASLAAPDFQARSQALAKQAAGLEADAREGGLDLDRRSKEGFAEIRAALLAVVGQIAEARRLDIVLTSSAMVLQNPDLDLTDEALVRLDQALPVAGSGSQPARGDQ